MFLDKLFKTKKISMIEIPDPKSPFLFNARIVPVGASYECEFVPNLRREVPIMNLKQDEEVVLKEGTWKNQKMYYVLNKAGTDLAVLPEPLVKYLDDMVNDLELRATAEQNDPFVINLNVYGEYKKEWDFYDGTAGAKEKEYTYGVITNNDFPHIPVNEIKCKLSLVEDTYVIKAGRKMIGTIDPKKTERLTSMLNKYECITTVKLKPYSRNAGVLMILRF